MVDFFTKAGEVMERGFWPIPVKNKICPLPGWPMIKATEVELEHWQKRFADSDVGIICRDLLVVDVDPRNGGLNLLAKWLDEHGTLESNRIAKTKNKGLHFYFTKPEKDVTVKQFEGIDIKSGNAYVVAPPSRGYQWAADGIVGPPPLWLEELVCRPLPERPETKGTVSPEKCAEWMKDYKFGRNSQLYRLAVMCDGDLGPLMQAALNTGLSQKEIDQVIRSAMKVKQ